MAIKIMWHAKWGENVTFFYYKEKKSGRLRNNPNTGFSHEVFKISIHLSFKKITKKNRMDKKKISTGNQNL